MSLPIPRPHRRGDASPPGPARFNIAVGAGKGGVGKSTVSLNLALALAQAGHQVGLMDLDFYGPNIPLMVGLKQERWINYWALAKNSNGGRQEPIRAIERYGLKIASAGFILAEDQPMVVEGATVRMMAHQLLHQTEWGDLDYLIVDLPPGTADVLHVLLESASLAGAVLVVTPQDAAHLDARKAIKAYERSQVRILGAIENMSGAICPHCGKPVDFFPRLRDERSIWHQGVHLLGRIPLDARVSEAGDQGRPVLVDDPHSALAEAFRAAARELIARLAV